MKKIQWEDITISQYKQIISLFKRENMEDIDRVITMLSIINEDKDEEYFLNMPMDELTKWQSQLDFIKESPKPRIDKTITIGDNKYDVQLNVSKMKAGQYIDYAITMQEQPENYALIMSCICIPKGKTYNDGYNMDELIEYFEYNMKMVDVLGASVFFSTLLNSLTKTTLNYSKKQLKKELKKQKNPQKIEEIKKGIMELEKMQDLFG